MVEIEKFFREIDRLWESDRENKIPLQVIGSGALLLQTGYNRTTKDGDVLETLEVTPDIKENLTKLAGRGTPLHKRTGLYLDIVLSGLPFLPQEPQFHPQKKLNESLRHFSLAVLDVVDVAVSKLSRFNQNDSDDIRAMININLIDHQYLLKRFNAAVDRFSMDSRADDIPSYARNLHRVERDMLRVPESDIKLPDWMD